MPNLNNKYKDLRILIAEDDELSYLYIKIILKSLTKNFVRVKSGEELMRHLKTEPADILLLDVNLPDASGLDLAQILFEKYPNLGIILNSAFSLEDEREDVMKRSNFYYMSKPLKKEKMLDAFEKVLNSVAHK